MATLKVERPVTQSHLRFIVAVVDGCVGSDWAVLELLGSGVRPQNIQMFSAHQKPTHEKSAGGPCGQMQVTLRYLEDLLELDTPISLEYAESLKAGRHLLLVNVYRDNDAMMVAAVLGKAQSHAGRILDYGHSADLLTLTV